MAQLAHAARDTWSSKWAFILAAAASAVGLGNLWRFPYLAAKYGGGMFLLTYLVLVFTFGLSLLLVEIALGRRPASPPSVRSSCSARSMPSLASWLRSFRSSSRRTIA